MNMKLEKLSAQLVTSLNSITVEVQHVILVGGTNTKKSLPNCPRRSAKYGH